MSEPLHTEQDLEKVDKLIKYVSEHKIKPSFSEAIGGADKYLDALINLKLVLHDAIVGIKGGIDNTNLDDLPPLLIPEYAKVSAIQFNQSALSPETLRELEKNGVKLDPTEQIHAVRKKLFLQYREEMHQQAFEMMKELTTIKDFRSSIKVGIKLAQTLYKINSWKYPVVIDTLRRQAEERGDPLVLKNLLNDYKFSDTTPKTLKKFVNDMEYRMIAMRKDFGKIAMSGKRKELEAKGLGKVDVQKTLLKQYMEARAELMADFNYQLNNIYDIINPEKMNESQIIIYQLKEKLYKQLEQLDESYGLSQIVKRDINETEIQALAFEADDPEKFLKKLNDLKDVVITETDFKFLKNALEAYGQEVPDELILIHHNNKKVSEARDNFKQNAEEQKNLAPVRNYVKVLQSTLDDLEKKFKPREGESTAIGLDGQGVAILNLLIAESNKDKMKKELAPQYLNAKEELKLTLEAISDKINKLDPKYYNSKEVKDLIELQRSIKQKLFSLDKQYEKSTESKTSGTLVDRFNRVLTNYHNKLEKKKSQDLKLKEELKLTVEAISKEISELDPKYYNSKEMNDLVEFRQFIEQKLLSAEEQYEKSAEKKTSGTFVSRFSKALSARSQKSEEKKSANQSYNNEISSRTQEIVNKMNEIEDLVSPATRRNSFAERLEQPRGSASNDGVSGGIS